MINIKQNMINLNVMLYLFLFSWKNVHTIDMFSEWNNFKNKTSISTITVDRYFLNEPKRACYTHYCTLYSLTATYEKQPKFYYLLLTF